MPEPRTDDAADLRMRSFWLRCWREIVQLDGPTWRSIRRLLGGPGRSAAEHFEPTGEPRVHPVRLYLVVNVVFFFLAPWINVADSGFQLNVWIVDHQAAVELVPALGDALDRAIERSGIDADLYRAILDDRMRAQQGALVWLLIPFVAVASFAVARRRRRFLVEHLVLATNLVSFFLLSLLMVSLLARGIFELAPGRPVVLVIAAIVLLVWLVWLPWKVFRSLRVFLDLGRIRALLTTFWLGAALLVGITVYLVALFGLVLFGMRGLQVPTG